MNMWFENEEESETKSEAAEDECDLLWWMR
jgi:hypothetical protein